MNYFQKIRKLIAPYQKNVILNILFNALSVLFSLVSISMVIPFLGVLFHEVDRVLVQPEWVWSVDGAIQSFNYHLTHLIDNEGEQAALIYICALVLVVFFFKNLFRYAAMYFIVPVRNGVIRDMRNQLFKKLTQLPLAYFSDQKKGDLITRTTSDVQEVEWSILNVLELAFNNTLTIIFFLGAMLSISPTLTLLVLFILPIAGFLIGRIGKSLKKISLDAQNQLGVLISLIEESIAGLRAIKAFNAGTILEQKFGKANNHHRDLQNKMLWRRDLASPLSEFLSIVVVVVVLYLGGIMVLGTDSTLDAKYFIGFVAIFSQIIPPAKAFTSAIYSIQKGMASMQRIEEITEEAIELEVHIPDANIEAIAERIEYKNVSFAYEERVVLKNISLEIPKGKVVALVGQSGSGKTTLADLLPRFYDLEEGSILIDGINIKALSLNNLRNLIGVVTQSPILFNDTVWNNLTLGLDNISEEKVRAAAVAANAHSFIDQLEHGYQTYIGDGGNKLSGGEKQRLTIARALLKNPDILILDEATSSLDSESEQLVQQALNNLMQNRTVIVIAHRLSTIQHADEIIVLRGGEIVERGNHNSLLSKNGEYRKLVELQAF